MTEDNPVVGHKTLYDGTHIPLHKDEADALWAQIQAGDKRRREMMPDSMSALRTLHDAMTRLRDEGWRDGIYCPKDGSEFAIIEFGSTGIFSGVYIGEWPTGDIHMCDCVTHPKGILWKALDKLTEAERTQLEACAEAERQMMSRDAIIYGD